MVVAASRPSIMNWMICLHSLHQKVEVEARVGTKCAMISGRVVVEHEIVMANETSGTETETAIETMIDLDVADPETETETETETEIVIEIGIVEAGMMKAGTQIVEAGLMSLEGAAAVAVAVAAAVGVDQLFLMILKLERFMMGKWQGS